jgi:hypothetical protein
MNPDTSLKLASIAFAVLWAAWMIWSNGFTPANVVTFALVGALAGWLWFLGMRWFFRRIGRLPKA